MDPTIADTAAAEGDFFGRPGGILGMFIFKYCVSLNIHSFLVVMNSSFMLYISKLRTVK